MPFAEAKEDAVTRGDSQRGEQFAVASLEARGAVLQEEAAVGETG